MSSRSGPRPAKFWSVWVADGAILGGDVAGERGTRQGAYELYAERAVDPYREHFADDFKFHTRPEFPSQAVYGVDDLQSLWADLDETYTDYRLAPTDFAGVGDYVIVTLQASTRMKGSGVRIEETIYHVWHIRGGKALEAWTYSDREAALEAAGVRE